MTIGKLSKIHLPRFQRWGFELDLRSIKTTLGMEHLRCRTPEMAFKELWVYMLAYNLIRLLMAQSALLADQIPRQLSFKHATQIWLAWQQQGGDPDDGACFHGILILIAQPRVGLRLGRIERHYVSNAHDHLFNDLGAFFRLETAPAAGFLLDIWLIPAATQPASR